MMFMNRKNIITILFALAVFLIPVFSGFADDDTVSFVITPPPVSYPLFEDGINETQLGVNGIYADFDIDGTSMKIYGPAFFAGYQLGMGNRFALSSSIGAAILAGTEYSMLMFQIPMHVNAVYEVIRADMHSFFLIGGVGGDIGSSRMKFTVMQYPPLIDPVEDETTLSTFTITIKLTAGAQANIGMNNLMFSPFGLYTNSAGTYSSTMASSMSYDYPSSSGSIPNYSATVFGFDVLYIPAGVSLSSFIQNTDKYTMISLAFKWMLKKHD